LDEVEEFSGAPARRVQVFAIAGEQIRDREVLYLEFGVYRGRSMRIWSRLLCNPRSKLHGFDSFEGLPESWVPGVEKGYFAMDGAVPLIEDSRVSFFKGWFSKTLPKYDAQQHHLYLQGFKNTTMGGGHWNANGHRLADEMIARKICEMQLTLTRYPAANAIRHLAANP
jgi:hypothetical protein